MDIIKRGVFYLAMNGQQVDLFNVRYNRKNPNLFEIDELTSIHSREYLIAFFGSDSFDHLDQGANVNYSRQENLDLLIDAISRYYSNEYIGIRRVSSK